MLNNKGELVDDNQYRERDNKKNIIAELKSVQDFFSITEKLKQENDIIIKNKNNNI